MCCMDGINGNWSSKTAVYRLAVGIRGARVAALLFHMFICVSLMEAMTNAPNIRGISPEDEQYYQTAIIKCRDSSKTFSQERLNDDFCDCVDGTDEPGTNACPEAKFYCNNHGNKASLIFSSRVNDGICDCCDGSDEYDGKVECSKTCFDGEKDSRERLAQKTITVKDISLRNGVDEQAFDKYSAEMLPLKQEEKAVTEFFARGKEFYVVLLSEMLLLAVLLWWLGFCRHGRPRYVARRR